MPSSPYRIVKHLGSGASGVVWGAERDGREVAVKVLHSRTEAASAEGVRREMRIGPMIADHPGIVGVRRVEIVDGSLHLEMDWVRGPSLAQVVERRIERRRGPLPATVAVRWAIEILDALDWAGRTVSPSDPGSFVHRDVKPANLLLDPSGRVRITDFGIARASADLGFQTTAAGTVKGTPRFMAPEVLMERSVTARADQFSVGAVLFELLTLQPLYVGRDLAEVLLQAVQADVDRRLPLVRSPQPVVDVLRRMLARDPADRFPDHAAAADALRALALDGPSVDGVLADLVDAVTLSDDPPDDDDLSERTGAIPEDDAETTMPRLAGPRTSETLPLTVPVGEMQTMVLRSPAMSTLSGRDVDLPTQPGEMGFDEMGAFAEPDQTTDVSELLAEAKAEAKAEPRVKPRPVHLHLQTDEVPLRPTDELPTQVVDGQRVGELLASGRLEAALSSAFDSEAPTKIRRALDLPPEPAPAPGPGPGPAPASKPAKPRKHAKKRTDKPAPARKAQPAGVRREDPWLVAIAVLVVLLGIAAAGGIVAAALWWNGA